MFSAARSPTVVSPSFKQGFAHAKSLPFGPGPYSPSPHCTPTPKALTPVPLHSPLLRGSGFDLLPTPLRAHINLMIPSQSACQTVRQQYSYFPPSIEKQKEPVSTNPDTESKLDSLRVGMVRCWGQSIDIETKPIFIADPQVLEHQLSALQVADGNETSTMKTVNGRVATPYKEKNGWVGQCACNVTRKGQACLLHESCIPE